MHTENLCELKERVNRRRTFAIISHPDAGKTTLTEKLLLLGGAIRLAGSVKAKKSKKFATSDWMELEKQRGISVSTSVMRFEYKTYICNLLDTPGHQDFSEDTYRTLTAADAAIMLIDAAKGIEPQTLKLYEVCKLRGIPIFTFINKLDRESRDPFELLQEIENVLSLQTYPMNWPISSGERFRGIIDRETRSLHYFEGRNTTTETIAKTIPLFEQEEILKLVPKNLFDVALEELELVETAGNEFSIEDFIQGKISPVFFGAAMTNFGVRLFLEKFLTLAPPPSAKKSSIGLISPYSKNFSGFIFKIQANMDPKHRDRVAFLRIVSGLYQTGNNVMVPRLKREIRLTNPQQFFAQERVTLEDACAGDIVGIYDPGIYSIGDTLVENGNFEFEGIPAFAPEHFVVVRTTNALKRKQLMKGLEQLCQEGTMQMFTDIRRSASDPILGAVGSLQFDVMLFRLNNEYNTECTLDTLNYTIARWVEASENDLLHAKNESDVAIVVDQKGNNVLLFRNEFEISYFQDHFPNIKLLTTGTT